MSSNFERPENSSFPVVHYTFKAKSLHSDELVEYRVQDLPEEYFEQAIDFMLEYFLPDEPLQQAKSPESRAEAPEVLRNFWREIVKCKVSLICFAEGSDDIVGMNMLKVVTKAVEQPVDEDKMSEVVRVMRYIGRQFDVFEHFGVDHYLNGYGLGVDKAYRGRGIATALLAARGPLLRCLNLKVTSTVFTSIGSQKAAASAGYGENYSITYQELEKKFQGLDFSEVVTRDCKILSLEI